MHSLTDKLQGVTEKALSEFWTICNCNICSKKLSRDSSPSTVEKL